MEGWLGGVFAVFGLTDMYFNDCQTSCLAVESANSAWHIQTGAVEFNNRWIGHELLLGYDMDRTYGPFQPTAAVSLTDTGEAWAGIGLKCTSKEIFDSPIYFETSFLPGLQYAGDGPDLGGPIQFRGSIGFGYELDNGAAILLAYDHRSNAHIWETNPGLETFHLRLSLPLN